jgi:hypothetical protein
LTLALGKYPLIVIAASVAIASRSSGQTVAPVNILAGSQALITPDSARFVFPRQATDSYEWDVPIHGDPPTGGGGYVWDVSWETPADRTGIDPCGLWLVQYWKSGGPHKGPLKSLTEWLRIEPIIKDTKNVSGFSFGPKVDTRKVFATVEDGQLVFVIRGADAVQQIFPAIPSKVTFRAIIDDTPPHRFGSGSSHEYKTVMVNTPNSPEIRETRRSKCDNMGDEH